jgi:hypothetical protein
MQRKIVVMAAFYLLGGLALIILLGTERAALPVFALFLLVGIGQFFWFRCPHCGKIAFIREGGWASPFVGTHCRHCGNEY